MHPMGTTVSFAKRMQEQRAAILARWQREVLESFPRQSRKLIAAGQDRFANPLGFALREGVEEVFSFVAGEKPWDEIESALERLVKLRAVQETGGQGPLEFLFALKTILREACGVGTSGDGAGGEPRGLSPSDLEQWLVLEERIDRVIQAGVAAFVRAREKILELQVNEMRNKTYMLRRLAGEA